MSYKFDSLPMSLSIFFAILASAPTGSTRYRQIFYGAIWLALALCFYQASLNIFLATTVLFIFSSAERNVSSKDIFIEILASNIIKSFIAIAAYSQISSYFLGSGEYVVEHSRLIELNREGGLRAADNFWSYFYIIVSSFDPSQKRLLFFVLLLTGFGCALVARKALTQSQQNRDRRYCGIILIIVLASPLLIPAFSVGCLVFFNQPLFVPRVLVAFGITLVFAGFASAVAILELIQFFRSSLSYRFLRSLAVVPAASLLLLGITYSYAFSVAQAAQRDYDISLVRRIEYAIQHIGIQEGRALVIKGVMPTAARALEISKRFPAVAWLVPRYLSDEWYWGHEMLRYYGLEFSRLRGEARKQLLKDIEGDKPAYTGTEFRLYDLPEALVLEFR